MTPCTYTCGKCGHAETAVAGTWPAFDCPQCGSGAWTTALQPADQELPEWLTRWMSGEQVGASTGIAADETTYGFGDLSAHGYWSVPVPAEFVAQLDRAYEARRAREASRDNGPGVLEVGVKDGQVVVNLPRDMTGHIAFSVQQAHDFAHTVVRQALLASGAPADAHVLEVTFPPGPPLVHAYVETVPYRGCADCGLGPGSAVHNVQPAVPEKQREGDQPLPEGGRGPAIQDLVIADIEARKAVGLRRYGQLLHAHDGRDNLRDLYEELEDALIYTRKALYERDGR